MNRLEKIDHKIKRNYRYANIVWFVFIILLTAIETHAVIRLAKGTIEYIKTF
jgi:hypothetical protein